MRIKCISSDHLLFCFVLYLHQRLDMHLLSEYTKMTAASYDWAPVITRHEATYVSVRKERLINTSPKKIK